MNKIRSESEKSALFCEEIVNLAISRKLDPKFFMMSIAHLLISTCILNKTNKPYLLSNISTMWEHIENQLNNLEKKNEME